MGSANLRSSGKYFAAWKEWVHWGAGAVIDGGCFPLSSCKWAAVSFQTVRGMLENPTEAVNDMSYFDCIDSVMENSKVLYSDREHSVINLFLFNCKINLKSFIWQSVFVTDTNTACPASAQRHFIIVIMLMVGHYIRRHEGVSLVLSSCMETCGWAGGRCVWWLLSIFRYWEKPWREFPTMPRAATCQSLGTQSVLLPKPCVGSPKLLLR